MNGNYFLRSENLIFVASEIVEEGGYNFVYDDFL